MTLRSAGGGLVYDFPGAGMTMNTDVSGVFTVPVGSLPAGTYNWRVKSTQVGEGPTECNPGFLSTSGTIDLIGAAVTNVEMGLQGSGDSNNDDRVSIVDFVLVKLSFGQQPGQPSWDRRADFDGNGRITAIDFIQLKVNFGHSGAPPIRPTGP
jgi:Dockerin type I domain